MSSENISPQILGKIAREMQKMMQKPPEGIKIIVNEENITDIQAELQGPVGTPFEGGVFRLKLVLSSDFPSSPPKGFFLTKIFLAKILAKKTMVPTRQVTNYRIIFRA